MPPCVTGSSPEIFASGQTKNHTESGMSMPIATPSRQLSVTRRLCSAMPRSNATIRRHGRDAVALTARRTPTSFRLSRNGSRRDGNSIQATSAPAPAAASRAPNATKTDRLSGSSARGESRAPMPATRPSPITSCTRSTRLPSRSALLERTTPKATPARTTSPPTIEGRNVFPNRPE